MSNWKQMQCQIKVVKCNVGGHFENMAATFEFDGILGGQHFLLDKEGKMYVHIKFHACITICTILVLSRSTNLLLRCKTCSSSCVRSLVVRAPGTVFRVLVQVNIQAWDFDVKHFPHHVFIAYNYHHK